LCIRSSVRCALYRSRYPVHNHTITESMIHHIPIWRGTELLGDVEIETYDSMMEPGHMPSIIWIGREQFMLQEIAASFGIKQMVYRALFRVGEVTLIDK
jgi:hypothetical protein